MLKKAIKKSFILATQIPFFGGGVLALASLMIVAVVLLALLQLAIYLDHDPMSFIITGLPIYLVALPFFLIGFILFLEEYWMLFGIYKILGWKNNWIKDSLRLKLK